MAFDACDHRHMLRNPKLLATIREMKCQIVTAGKRPLRLDMGKLMEHVLGTAPPACLSLAPERRKYVHQMIVDAWLRQVMMFTDAVSELLSEDNDPGLPECMLADYGQLTESELICFALCVPCDFTDFNPGSQTVTNLEKPTMPRTDSEDAPKARWVVIENGSPFREPTDDDEEEEDEFGWELAIAREGSHGTRSWGWFNEEKLMVSAGDGGHEGSMTPDLWEALRKLAHEECARMNKEEGFTKA